MTSATFVQAVGESGGQGISNSTLGLGLEMGYWRKITRDVEGQMMFTLSFTPLHASMASQGGIN